MEPFDLDFGTVRRYALGDCLAVLLFVAAGELRHGVNPLVLPDRFVAVALPFLVGWALAGAALGAYSARIDSSRRALLARTAGAWFVADLLGQGIRGTSLFPGDADPAFFAVALFVGGGLLVLWRLVRFTVDVEAA